MYIHLSSSDRNLENGATLVGKEKGILAKLNFSFYIIGKAKFHFNSRKYLFSPYYVKGIVPDLGREYKDDIVPPSGDYRLVKER